MLATPEGRAHVLSLMVAAEEGDEAGVFDRLIDHVEDPKLRRVIGGHKADEERHAGLYRACLARNGLAMGDVPGELSIIREVAKVAGGVFAAGDASAIASDLDVMRTYALLLAIEARGVQQFPLIGAEFRRLGDTQTADVFDRVTKDEAAHVNICRTLGRKYAPDDATWEAAVAHYREVEQRAFEKVGIAGLRHALAERLVQRGLAAVLRKRARRLLGRAPVPAAA
jgi:rubrerythrin